MTAACTAAAALSTMTPASLSDFEQRCLLKHLDDCRELLQLTLRGAGQAVDKTGGARRLREVRSALAAAEREVAFAQRAAHRHGQETNGRSS